MSTRRSNSSPKVPPSLSCPRIAAKPGRFVTVTPSGDTVTKRPAAIRSRMTTMIRPASAPNGSTKRSLRTLRGASSVSESYRRKIFRRHGIRDRRSWGAPHDRADGGGHDYSRIGNDWPTTTFSWVARTMAHAGIGHAVRRASLSPRLVTLMECSTTNQIPGPPTVPSWTGARSQRLCVSFARVRARRWSPWFASVTDVIRRSWTDGRGRRRCARPLR